MRECDEPLGLWAALGIPDSSAKIRLPNPGVKNYGTRIHLTSELLRRSRGYEFKLHTKLAKDAKTATAAGAAIKVEHEWHEFLRIENWDSAFAPIREIRAISQRCNP